MSSSATPTAPARWRTTIRPTGRCRAAAGPVASSAPPPRAARGGEAARAAGARRGGGGLLTGGWWTHARHWSSTGPGGPYWPGGAVEIDDGAPPRPVRLLDDPAAAALV